MEHVSTRPDQPFILYLAYDAPHAALQIPTQEYPKGGGINGGLQWTGQSSTTPSINTASGTRDSYIHPGYVNKDWSEGDKRHASMIRRLYNAAGDIIQLLKYLDIDEETLIIFTSDNGPHHKVGSGGQFAQNPELFQSYANLNGIKRDIWEGGIRIPTICRYRVIIPESSIVTYPSGQWDWLATFADVAKAAIPVYTDGVSLMPFLTQQSDNKINDKRYLYGEYFNNSETPSYADFEISKRGRKRGQMQFIRIGDYKGVRYNIESHNSTPYEIYNVVTDERERVNLASSMPELHQERVEKNIQMTYLFKTIHLPGQKNDENKIDPLSGGFFLKGLE
ncbi:sulfatase-like hydrolase/transferase [Arenibacter certesii]|nr:sulfatase-like hydrolase/transferase [Arenibacter certesii]